MKKSIKHYIGFFADINFMFIFRLVTDNVDFIVQARHQTKTSQNKSLNWSHAFAVKNRVQPMDNLCYDEPQSWISDFEVGEILPSADELKEMYLVPLVYRVIVNYMPVYSSFKPGIEYHIPHPFSKEMRQKSEQVLTYMCFSCTATKQVVTNFSMHAQK